MFFINLILLRVNEVSALSCVDTTQEITILSASQSVRELLVSTMTQRINFKGSLKDVPHSSKREYFMKMNHQAKKFVRNISWAATFFIAAQNGKKISDKKVENYGFRSLNDPDPVPCLKPFFDDF